MLVGGTGRAILDWLDGQISMNRDELIDDLAAMWVVIGDGAALRAANRPSPRTHRRTSEYEGLKTLCRNHRERRRPLVEVSNRLSLENRGKAGARDRRRVG
jgi:hypothetical protein